MTKDDLGPMPEPITEPGEPNPGGVDAITGDLELPTVPDLPPDLNPVVLDDAYAAAELQGGEDTSTQATEGEEPPSPEQESPA